MTSGAAQSGAAGGSALQRLDAIEAALTQLTAKTESVEIAAEQGGERRHQPDRRYRVSPDRTGRLRSGHFAGRRRLAAMWWAAWHRRWCLRSAGPELAVGEQADFDRAKAVLGTGDFRAAANQFATFTQTYPGGPLTEEAHFLRGEALTQLGETADAARAYLEAFSRRTERAACGGIAVETGAGPGHLGADARCLRDAGKRSATAFRAPLMPPMRRHCLAGAGRS